MNLLELRQAGFSDSEIGAYVNEQKGGLLSAGFSEQEVNDYLGIPTVDDGPVKEIAYQLTIRQGEEPSFLDKILRAFEPSWEKRRARAAISITAARETGLAPSKFEPSLTDAIEQGLKQSVSGLLYTGKAPEGVPPETQRYLPITTRLAAQAATLAGDFPFMVGGAVLGAEGGPPTAIGGAFALPQGLRKVLMDKYERGEIASFGDFWKRLTGAVYETLKGEAVGIATGRAGLAVTGPARIPVEIATMVTVGDALEGKIPEPEEFLDAAILIGGVHGATSIAGKLRNIYAKVGKKPSEVLEDIKEQPAIREDLAAENKPVPDIYEDSIIDMVIRDMFDAVASGEAGRFIRENVGEGWVTRGIGSGYPDWFRDLSKEMNVTKDQYLTAITKALTGERLGKKQWEIWFRTKDIARKLSESGEYTWIEEGVQEAMAETRLQLYGDQLKKGDRLWIDQERFEVREFDERGNAVLEDGKTFKLDPDEPLFVDRYQPYKAPRVQVGEFFPEGPIVGRRPAPEVAAPPEIPKERPDHIKRILGKISTEKEPKRPVTWGDLYTATVDDLNPLYRMVKNMARGEKIPTEQDAYKLARLMKGWHGKATHFLEHSPYRFADYKNIGKPLKNWPKKKKLTS